MISLRDFLIVSSLLLGIGIYGVLTRRNLIVVLMSIELIFNAASINLVAFNRYLHSGSSSNPELWGQGFVVFVITLAAAEAVVGLALVLAIYRNLKSVYIDKMNILGG